MKSNFLFPSPHRQSKLEKTYVKSWEVDAEKKQKKIGCQYHENSQPCSHMCNKDESLWSYLKIDCSTNVEAFLQIYTSTDI